MTSMARPPGVSCPECGRQVPPQGSKLCPHCGYPLMLDRPAQVEEVQHKILHKPIDSADTGTSRTTQVPMPSYPAPMGPPGPSYPGPPPPAPVRYTPPPRAQAFGPHCPACHHVNPPPRKRCEICGQELWPGAAAPARWMPEPPPVTRTRPRRSWWKVALAIGIPVAIMGGVWALALYL